MSEPVVLGIDPASRNAGIAVVQGEKLLFSQQVIINKKPSGATEDLCNALLDWAREVDEVINKWKPSLVVVEHTSVLRNMNTTKMLTYFEAMVLLCAAGNKILCERVRTKQARKEVIGNGNADKSDVQAWVYNKYNQTFGQDESEAIVFALYGSAIING